MHILNRQEPVWQGSILYDSQSVSSWKRQNHEDRKRIRDCQGLGEGGGMDRWSTEDVPGSETRCSVRGQGMWGPCTFCSTLLWTYSCPKNKVCLQNKTEQNKKLQTVGITVESLQVGCEFGISKHQKSAQGLEYRKLLEGRGGTDP